MRVWNLIKVFAFGLLPLLAASAETVTIRSGNGAVGGTDASIRLLLGPSTGNFGHAFTANDFSAAQNAPAAFIVNPNPLWISGLGADPSAKWISAKADPRVGNTALYAVSFSVLNAFSAANMVLNYAVDDAIGDTVINNGPNTGIYINGLAACGSAFGIGFSQQHSASCDVSSLVHVGTNWLYIEGGNVAGISGLLFSATVTTTVAKMTAVTIRSGNGTVGGTDSQIKMLIGPPAGAIGHVFTAADFAAAQTGPSAYVVTPNALWIAALSADPSAKWVSSVNNSIFGNTALYAVSFQISDVFTAATLALNYAVDDGIGDGYGNSYGNSGIYLNGSAVCGGGTPNRFQSRTLHQLR